MNKTKIIIAIFLFGSSLMICQTNQNDFPVLNGTYLGQKLPGLIPEIFARGIISTDDMENNIFFADDGREIYIERTGTGKSIIYLYKLGESGWLDPVEVKFNDDGGYNQPTSNTHLGVLLTGRTILKENQPPQVEISIRKREGENWGISKMLVQGLRGSISNNGAVYATILDFSKGFWGRIARYIPQDEVYVGLEFLSEAVNDPRFSSDHSIVAPDESFLIFSSKRDNDSKGGLYISFRDEKGNWSQAQNLSAVLKTPQSGNEWLASFSSDGKYLFYNVSGDIYWVDAKIIDQLRPTNKL